MACLTLAASAGAAPAVGTKIAINDPWIQVGCSFAKHLEGRLEGSRPTITLFFLGNHSAEGLEGTATSLSLTEEDKPEKGAVIAIDAKQISIQSTLDLSKKILMGEAKIDLRDYQNILPTCHEETLRLSQAASLEFAHVEPVTIQLTHREHVCKPQGVAGKPGITVFRPYIIEVFEISNGAQKIPLVSENFLPQAMEGSGFKTLDGCKSAFKSN